MFRGLKRMTALAVLAGVFWCGGILRDSAKLRDDLIRLHVVGASDEAADQQVKLRVRDAVLACLESGMEAVKNPREAYAYVQEKLPEIREAAESALRQAGFSQDVTVSLEEEPFPVREYDTFTLPSGIYRSLRVVIGEGLGHNWWCVVFPRLCTGAVEETFAETARTGGLPDSLTGALTGEYEIRFWVLDQLGKLGNFLRGTSE